MKKYLILLGILFSAQIGLSGQSSSLSENSTQQFSAENKWCLLLIDHLFFDHKLLLQQDTIPKSEAPIIKINSDKQPMDSLERAKLIEFYNKFSPSGGGLSGRKIVKSAPIGSTSSTSEKTGTVVIQICLNQKGEVESADFFLEGSTTTDQQLIDLSIENAKKWLFEESTIEKQCGTITYNFKLK